jgi:hypothetical protein
VAEALAPRARQAAATASRRVIVATGEGEGDALRGIGEGERTADAAAGAGQQHRSAVHGPLLETSLQRNQKVIFKVSPNAAEGRNG